MKRCTWQHLRYNASMTQTVLRAILIAGPTGSGKSTHALDIAETENGVIINADSMQVYAHLRILTARPNAGDEARLPHRLYGHIDGAEPYSVGQFQIDATREIAAAISRDQTPILVGGTGLYFRALTEGLSPIPEIPDDVRSHWRQEAERLGAAGLHAILTARDPETAAVVRPSDPQRVTRALEVHDATGRPLAEWQRVPGTPVLQPGTWRGIVVAPDRQEIYRRCDARFLRMFEGGAVGEVRTLLGHGLPTSHPVMRALGVRPIADMLAGTSDPARATERAQTETRHYVKRQLTWLRRNMMSSEWKFL